MKTAFGTDARRSYAQWVGRAIALARGRSGSAVSLFESSVPEPRALLREAVRAVIEPDWSSLYVSAFSGGNTYVIDAIAEKYGVERDAVLCTTGATGALSLLYRTFAHPGDHILIETPGFDLFRDLADARGLEIELFRRHAATFAIDVADVERRIRPDTRLIIVSNLHNPSGTAIPHADMVALAEMAERRGVLLVVDEVYGDYAASSARPAPAASLSPAVVSVSSLTKIFGLATLRCGWIVADPNVIAAARDIDSRLDFNRSNLAHAVAAHVLRDQSAFRAHSDTVLALSRPIVVAWLAEMIDEGLVRGRMPDAGCILFPRLVGIENTEIFAEQLIERRGIIVAPGEYFDAPGHVRIGFGLEPDVLRAALFGLSDELRRLRSAASRKLDTSPAE